MPKLLHRSKLPRPDDPEILRAVHDGTLRGLPRAKVALLAGIHERTLWDWLAIGDAALHDAQLDGTEPGSHAVFAQTIKEAELKLMLGELDAWRVGDKTWTAHATLLERRFPQDFGRRDRLDVETRSVSVTVTASLSDATTESLRELLAERAALREIEPPRGTSLALPAPQPAPSPPHAPADA